MEIHRRGRGLRGEGDSSIMLLAGVPPDAFNNIQNNFNGLPQQNHNQNRRNRHHTFERFAIFTLYFLYEALVFLLLFSIGIIIFRFMAFLSRNGVPFIGSIGSYSNILYICLFLKLIQDYIEHKFLEPLLTPHFLRFPSFRPIFLSLNMIIIGICYMMMFRQFYYRCKLLRNTTIFSTLNVGSKRYIISLCYIHYSNVFRCIRGSVRTNVLHQLIQNGLNIKFGMMILKFGGICGTLIFLDRAPVKYGTTLLTSVTILMTLTFLGIQKIAFRYLRMESGTKWAEILWGSLTTDFLLKCYLNMKSSDQIQPLGIQFHIGIAYTIFLTTKITFGDFVQLSL